MERIKTLADIRVTYRHLPTEIDLEAGKRYDSCGCKWNAIFLVANWSGIIEYLQLQFWVGRLLSDRWTKNMLQLFTSSFCLLPLVVALQAIFSVADTLVGAHSDFDFWHTEFLLLLLTILSTFLGLSLICLKFNGENTYRKARWKTRIGEKRCETKNGVSHLVKY